MAQKKKTFNLNKSTKSLKQFMQVRTDFCSFGAFCFLFLTTRSTIDIKQRNPNDVWQYVSLLKVSFLCFLKCKLQKNAFTYICLWPKCWSYTNKSILIHWAKIFAKIYCHSGYIKSPVVRGIVLFLKSNLSIIWWLLKCILRLYFVHLSAAAGWIFTNNGSKFLLFFFEVLACGGGILK